MFLKLRTSSAKRASARQKISDPFILHVLFPLSSLTPAQQHRRWQTQYSKGTKGGWNNDFELSAVRFLTPEQTGNVLVRRPKRPSVTDRKTLWRVMMVYCALLRCCNVFHFLPSLHFLPINMQIIRLA